MPFDPERYATGLRAANERERREIERRAEAALREAQRIAGEIGRGDAAVERVVLFGSLAEGSPGTARFDIDLALEGGDVYAAMEVAESSPWPVDIVDLDRLPEHIQQAVARNGRVLYRSGAPATP